jgi:6-pyruvoyltetrahydropterin/6-carboxytetrahydropterin synthase
MSSLPNVDITRKVRFSASHRYHRDEWSDEKNREVFGACNNPFGHGHNYELEVTLAGPLDPETGMVINLREVDSILREEIVARFDHRHINREVEGFETLVPTTENIVLHIWDRLEPVFTDRGVKLRRVRVYEDPFLWAEHTGPDR